MDLEKPCQDFLKLSRKLGGNSLIIQGAGGNTAIKEGGRMWIKASGKKLSKSLERDTFILVDPAVAIKDIEEVDLSKKEVTLNENIPRPSIETCLHAIMPHKVTLHTHPVDLIALTTRETAERQLKDKLKDINWGLVKYARPGLPLYKRVKEEIKELNCDAIILENHGLLVGGNTVKEAEHMHDLILRRLKQEKRVTKNTSAMDNELKKLSKTIVGSKLPSDSVVNTLGTDKWSLNLAKKNPLYPDHVVFCGSKANISNKDTIPVSSKDKYCILEGLGVLLFESCTNATEEMLVAQAETLLRIPIGEKVKTLTDKDCDDLLNWESEKYRQQMQEEIN